MVIGFEAKRLFQNRSGLGNYSRNTVNLLARFYPENKYLLFAPKLTTLFSPSESVQVILPKSKFFARFASYWRIYRVARLAKKYHTDIFHGLSHVLPAGIEKKGIPTIVTIHDLIFLRFPSFYRQIDRQLYYHNTMSSCRRCTKVLAISHQTKEDIIHYLGIPEEKIVVLHQSCDKRFYEKVDEDQKYLVRQKYQLPEKFILCVGTIEQRKNQLAILMGVVSEQLTIPVVLLGKPTEYKKILDEFIIESGIRKQLIFLHNTDFFELQAIYQLAEIMVYPSFFEGFGLPVLEAQASGCPVITSNISSLPEAGGDGAVYVDPSNSSEIGMAIRKVLTDNEFKEELIKKGTANALMFSDQAVGEKLFTLYQSLVKGN
ncbi:MAG: glycosyltransferase family 4 protein [Prolixibacteraceae bacterium]|jgi:glycosyltransferase involved in cell wall biosynthesis|nr:glycosyltransferase family 4 protein [Prolixibacteraceae bacterium]